MTRSFVRCLAPGELAAGTLLGGRLEGVLLARGADSGCAATLRTPPVDFFTGDAAARAWAATNGRIFSAGRFTR